jgi:hypothetical protein
MMAPMVTTWDTRRARNLVKAKDYSTEKRKAHRRERRLNRVRVMVGDYEFRPVRFTGWEVC